MDELPLLKNEMVRLDIGNFEKLRSYLYFKLDDLILDFLCLDIFF
jgi:hypothetical protein